MKLKLLWLVPLILCAQASFAWPPIPKAIASGTGTCPKQNGTESFIWVVGMSVVKHQNVYVLIASHLEESDRLLLERAKIEIILYDDESILVRMKFDTAHKNSEEITLIAINRLTAACSNLEFNTRLVLYNPRP